MKFTPRVAEVFSNKPAQGDVGLEIELEGNSFPRLKTGTILPGDSFWSYTKDGSLRGEDNAEYVLTSPVLFEEVTSALGELKQRLLAHETVLDDSNRTSVHVHLNFQQKTLKQLASFCTAFICFEEILTHWCGDHRVGNLFCLSTADAPDIISELERFLTFPHDCRRFNGFSDKFHYAGLNFSALQKFGSVEIRTLRGVQDFSIIQTWVKILQRLIERTELLKSPEEVIQLYSGGGAEYLLTHFFGQDLAQQVIRECNLDAQEIEVSVRQGMRRAQTIAYCQNWSDFAEFDETKDPFKRSHSAFKIATHVSKTKERLQDAY